MAGVRSLIGGQDIPPTPPPAGIVIDTNGQIYLILYAIIGLCQQIQAKQDALGNNQTAFLNNQATALNQLQAIVSAQAANQSTVIQLFGAVEATLAAVLQRVPTTLAPAIGGVVTTLETLSTKIGMIMATQAEVQAAADAIKDAMATLQTEVAAEDAAIGQILAWVQANPGTVPDALVQELKDAQTAAAGVVTDVQAQTASLTAGTPAPAP
jgi:hypothetical protein